MTLCIDNVFLREESLLIPSEANHTIDIINYKGMSVCESYSCRYIYDCSMFTA